VSNCITVPAELTVNMRVQVNKKSVLQVYCLCSPDELFDVAPLFSISNESSNPTVTRTKSFKVNGNMYIGFRVIPADGAQGENPSDARQQFTGPLLSNPNQIQMIQVSDRTNTQSMLHHFLCTADNYRAAPVEDDLFGHAIVGERHELHARDPPVSGAPLSYLPIGAKGLTCDNAYDILQGVAARTVATLDPSPSSPDAAILSYFPEESRHNEMTYFYTALAGSSGLTPDTNPHLDSLTTVPPNATSPQVAFDLFAITAGPVDVNGVFDSATPAGRYLQVGYALPDASTSRPHGGVVYIVVTVNAL